MAVSRADNAGGGGRYLCAKLKGDRPPVGDIAFVLQDRHAGIRSFPLLLFLFFLTSQDPHQQPPAADKPSAPC